MNKAVHITIWLLVGVLGWGAQIYIAKWATETERDPDLAETALFTPEMYPEIAERFEEDALRRHVEALSAIPSRMTGTPGADEAAEYIIEHLRTLGAGEPVTQEFDVTIPVHDRAEIVSGGDTYTIYPVFPNGVCPAAFPEEGFETRLIYAGFGRLSDVEGKDLDGATVVVETGAREQWLYLIDLGARAIIFVENERPAAALWGFTQTGSHQNVPRFWMPKADGAPLLDRLKQDDLPATLYSDARWEQRKGRNIWVDIPGVSDAPQNEDEVVVLSAYYDSASFVPSLAPGAEQACGIAVLLELARLIRDYPFEKDVRILATAGHFQALAGAREYVWEHVAQYDSPMRDVSPQGHAGFFGLDLTSNSQRIGLLYTGHFFEQNATNLKPRLSDLGRRAADYVSGIEDRDTGEVVLAGIAETLGLESEVVFVDTINVSGFKDWWTYVPTQIAMDHEVALLAGIPALGFVTTDDTRFFMGTPRDTEVDYENLSIQAKVLSCLLPNAFNVEGRYLKRSLPKSVCRIEGRVVSFDPREGYLPNKPVPDAIVQARQHGSWMPFLSGVQGRPVLSVNEKGRFHIVGMATMDEAPPHKAMLAFEPYVLDGGQITWAGDFGQIGKASYPLSVTPVQKHMELMCVAFECRTVDVYNLIDPRHFGFLNTVEVLEAESNSLPARYGTTLVEPGWPTYSVSPTASIFASGDMRLKLTAGAGVFGPRMLLLNVPEGRELDDDGYTGEGFLVRETPAINHTYLQSARDMWRLNESRIQFFAGHGIEQMRVNELHGLARDAIERAEEALAEGRNQEYFSAAREALSLETRAYPDVLAMANDVVRGLLFYLVLLLPFAFTMERLFVAGRRIETRILGIIAFFLGMFTILRFTHPAFQIVLSSMVVLLGFSVATLSCIVISIVMGKLEMLVSKRKQEQEGEHESGVQAVSGFALALELGIANMRRRKARTILTSVTLVVLTFSVLSFASVTAQIRTQRYRYDDGATPYRGFLLRTRHWSPFPFEAYASIRNEYGDVATIAPRRWYYGALVANRSYTDIRKGSIIRSVNALLGLTAQEREFHDIEAGLLGRSRWLSPEEPGVEPPMEIVLPVNLADQFLGRVREEEDPEDLLARLTDAQKVRIANEMVGQQVRLLGHAFTVVGVYDPPKMNELLDIDGETLTPFDPVEMEKKAQEEGAPDPEEVQRYIHHSWENVAVLSERVLGNLGGDLRAIAILPHNPDDLEPLLEEFVRRIDFILFANLDGVPTLLSSRNATRVSEVMNLVILMVIAGLIVFNTMLGSVYERTKEIGTYTALGIAPSHIGRLFLVEAFVFSILGAMAGYVLGQSTARLVHAFELSLLDALNLNYSSLAGVLACMVVMGMVIGSAWYPSRKASEIGVPDIERRWKLPKTKEARVTLELPFTVSYLEAQGLVVFMKEFLDSHIDVSVGSFYCENVDAGTHLVSGDEGTGVRAQFWLTPFDLGVSQYATFRLEPIANLDVCGVQVDLERLSGDAGSWRRANGSFMTTMRSQFLIWRNLKAETRAEYVERGKEYGFA